MINFWLKSQLSEIPTKLFTRVGRAIHTEFFLESRSKSFSRKRGGGSIVCDDERKKAPLFKRCCSLTTCCALMTWSTTSTYFLVSMCSRWPGHFLWWLLEKLSTSCGSPRIFWTTSSSSSALIVRMFLYIITSYLLKHAAPQIRSFSCKPLPRKGPFCFNAYSHL